MIAPPDFALHYHWQQGALPPPHHYSMRVRVEPDGSGAVEMRPGYATAEVPTWTAPLALGPDARDALYDALCAAGLHASWRSPARPPIGGSHWRLTVTASGETVTIRSAATNSDGRSPDALREAVRAAVPAAVWDDLHARRSAFVSAYRRRQ